MASVVTWLDFSSDQQRNVMALLRSFEEKGTVDDLGLGTIRDAISNALYPGTSTLHTRARYLLFIPWIYQQALLKNPDQLAAVASVMEKRLIQQLLDGGESEGVIGNRAKNNLKNLPSTLYWSALQTYGIFRIPGCTKRQFERTAALGTPGFEYEGEYTTGGDGFWGDVPDAPVEMRRREPLTMTLDREEATWLMERFISTASPPKSANLLASLATRLRTGDTSGLGKGVPFWDERVCRGSDDIIRALVSHAQRFAHLAHGASLRYNSLLLDKKTRSFGPLDDEYDYEAELGEWVKDARVLNLRTWCQDLAPFWSTLNQFGWIAKGGAVAFTEGLARSISDEGESAMATSRMVADLIEKREITHKKNQARFRNPGRLRSFRGEAGLRPMTFRWEIARRFLDDVAGGLGLEVN